ncbi:hypothetical protein AsFcp4_186 [Aeromonas phage AsFcp_4]|uniref:Uncharacterized protein a-gt.5 n=1 Tax=Aeromonas phage PX29 TaxID=926067 RepID=E5DPV9_9CAUD|nr:a-gt.5 conserved hypothetical protein [Aeromonas phage PX29]ADQ52745.1 a-gt.5 conserved hypothetical protein [Aeromonas phage PX29]QAX98608.1 hypothetical protein ASfcp2_275 [Aeromonas phage AsFcp_2]QAX99639.1 hypothetical protein AsFcp4_186 [Aeromonas phage AsFcp_4]
MMPTNNIEVTIPLWENYHECNDEPELVPYMLKIKLLESGIPVIIDPLSIRSNVISVKHGKLIGEIISLDTEESHYKFKWEM